MFFDDHIIVPRTSEAQPNNALLCMNEIIESSLVRTLHGSDRITLFLK